MQYIVETLMLKWARFSIGKLVYKASTLL